MNPCLNPVVVPQLIVHADLELPGQLRNRLRRVFSPSLVSQVAEIGLLGNVSNRMCPSALATFPQATDEDSAYPPSFSLPVLSQGKLHSVLVHKDDCPSLSRLPQLTNSALYPTTEAEVDPQRRPQIRYFGCIGKGSLSAQLIRRLDPQEEPKTWQDLHSMIQRAGYVQLITPLRGGSSTIGLNPPLTVRMSRTSRCSKHVGHSSRTPRDATSSSSL